MTDSVFDSTGSAAAPDSTDNGLSTLDVLREVGQEIDERQPIQRLNPLGTIRFTFRTDLAQHDVQTWQKAGLPAKARALLTRRGGAPNLADLDPVIMYALAIANTCILLEVKKRGTDEFAPVVDAHSGDPLTFADAALRETLGGLDRVTAVKNAMNRNEGAIMETGQAIINAAGLGEEGASPERDDLLDPTTR